MAAKKSERFADGHVEDVGDVPAAIFHVEDLAAIATAVTLGAFHVNVGQELHVDFEITVAMTRRTTATVDVETEVGGVQIARAGFDRLGKHRPNLIEGFDIGDRIRTR